MSKALTTTKISRESLQALDNLVSETGLSLSAQSTGAISEAVVMAEAIDTLRASITDDMMAVFLKLMNTPLGFKTDRDPTSAKKKDGQGRPLNYKGEIIEPYPIEIVKDCIIEALLRGVKVVGNQFNILASRMYITREGYLHLIKKVKELEDFSPSVGMPRKDAALGTYVQCRAKWRIKGQEFTIGDPDAISIPIKVDEYTTSDAVIGKAQRKFYKRVYEKMTGIDLPDGEVGDDLVPPNVTSTTAKTEAPPVIPVESNPVHADVISLREAIAKQGISEERLIAHLKSVRFIPLTVENLEGIGAELLAQIGDRLVALIAAVKAAK